MGLDMYLYRRENNDIVREQEEEVVYWRKANQIRHWFVEHLEGMNGNSNCEYFKVSKEILEQLVEDCKTVLNKRNIKQHAAQLLPTESGFFFGSTEYGEWYFNQLEDTVEEVEKVIETTDWETEVVEYFDWW